MHKKFLTLSAMILTGCVTSPSFSTTMNYLNGQPVSTLLAELGQPDQHIQQDDQTVLVFRPVMVNIPIPTPMQTTPTINGMGGAYVSPRPSSSYSIRANCRVAFIIKNDQVTDWYAQGKDCPSH